MKTPQLPRQLKLNINALSRSFRQALRHATKHDPQGTAETSPAWKAVAARQAMLENMLAAIGPFLQLQTPAEPAPAEPAAAAGKPEAQEGELLPQSQEAEKEDDEINADINAEEAYLDALPPDIRELQQSITFAMKKPEVSLQQRREKAQILDQLQRELKRKMNQWRFEHLEAAQAQGIKFPSSLFPT